MTQDVCMSAAQDREPLGLTERDLEDLEPFRSPGPARAALSLVAGTSLEGEVPEPELRHAVFRAGLNEVLWFVRLYAGETAPSDALHRLETKHYVTRWTYDASRSHVLVLGISKQPDVTAEHAARLIEEGLRMEAHPGIIFKEGPTGRRPAIANGPDVWEIIKFISEAEDRGAAALETAAEIFNLDPGQVNAAVSYYGDYKEEIDDWISRANEASEHAEKAWLAQQELMS